jgi:hypothetical protein
MTGNPEHGSAHCSTAGTLWDPVLGWNTVLAITVSRGQGLSRWFARICAGRSPSLDRGRTQLQPQCSTSEAGKQQVDQEAVAGHTPAGWEHSFPVDRPTLLATRRVLTAQSVPYTAASGNAVKALCVKGREERKSLGGRHVYHGVSTQ